jgi:hypothetical protein
MAANSMATAPEQASGFKKFLEGLRGFIRAYHELIAEIAAWLASISCIAIASVIFLSASTWRDVTINISLGLINLAVEAALFGSGGAYYAAKERGDESEKKRQAIISIFYGVLTLVTVAFGTFKVTDTYAVACLDLTRVAAAILYVFLSLNSSHTAPVNTTAANNRMAELEEQIAELKQLLETPVSVPEIVDIEAQVHTLGTQVHNLLQATQKPVDQGIQPVDLARFEQLANTVYSMQNSVVEVTQNVLNITQNLYTTQATQPGIQAIHDEPMGYTRIVEETPQLEGVDALKALGMPVLAVPGVSVEKVAQVIAAYLSGTSWRDMPGNYSKTIKPIRDAYTPYVDTATQRGLQVHNGV